MLPTDYLTSLVALLAGAVLKPGENNITQLWPTAAGGFTGPPSAVTSNPSPTRAVLRAAPRAYLLVGEEATPRGVASVARRSLFPPGSTIPSCTDDALGAALHRIATEITFGTAAPLSTAELDRHWTVGTLFPLPVWAVDTGAIRVWNVDVDRLTAAVTAVLPATAAAERTAAAQPARLLHHADATATAAPVPADQHFTVAMNYRDARRTDVATDPAAATEGARLAAEARWNPYAVLFALLETSIAIEVSKAGAAPFAAAFWADLTPPERAVHTTTSAGHVWLRRLWSWWGRAAAMTDLKTLLGLTADDLTTRAPGVVGELEPPLRDPAPPSPGIGAPAAQLPALPSPSPATVKKDLPIVAFGRQVPFVGAGYGKEYVGISTRGTATARQYLVPSDTSDPRVRPLDMTLVPGATTVDQERNKEQWGRILASIARTEGQLDAAAPYDRGMCSLGFQQWSMHVQNEGPVLLERVKNLSGVYYDAVVRALGIETGRVSDAAPSLSGASVTDLNTPACFFVLTPGAPPQKYPGGKTKAAVEKIRAEVFGWTPPSGVQHPGKRAMLLAARWSVVARYAPELWQAQAECGFNRFGRAAALIRDGQVQGQWQPIEQLDGFPIIGAGPTARPATALEMFPTEVLVGLVIDMAINTPHFLGAAMRRAVLRTIAVLGQDGLRGASSTLDAPFFLVLATEFLAERRYQGTTIPRGDEIGGTVPKDRTYALVDLFGTLRNLPRTPAGVVNPLESALISAGLPLRDPLSLTKLVTWP